MKQISDEEFLKLKGWEKVKGFKIDLEEMRDYPDNWDCFYFRKDDFKDFVSECEYWQLEEEAFEDKDYILESKYEEYMDEEGNLYDKPVQDIK